MVTLASSTIRVIVKELTEDGITYETIDAVHEYGFVGDGVTSNATAGATLAAAQIGNPNKIRVYLQPGEYSGIPENLLTGMDIDNHVRHMTIFGDSPVGGVWSTKIIGDDFMLHGGYGTRLNDNLGSVRLHPTTAGATSIRIKDYDPSHTGRTLAQLMALFPAGKAIMLLAYDLQAEGGPHNAWEYEYNTIVSQTAPDILNLATPLTYSMRDDMPVYEEDGTNSGYDYGGPVTAYVLYDWYNAEGCGIENIETSGGHQWCGGRAIYVKNCKFAQTFAPGVTANCVVDGLVSTGVLADVEIDKQVANLTITNSDIKYIAFQSANNVALITDSTIDTLNGVSRNFTCRNCTIDDLYSFVPGYGCNDTTTFENCVINSALPGRLLPGAVRCDGAVFGSGLVEGYCMDWYSRTGTLTAGDTVTGTNSGATGIVTNVISTFRCMIDPASITGVFERGEPLTGPSCSGTYRCNAFGREWAVPGAHLVVGNGADAPYLCRFIVDRLYAVNDRNYIATSRTSWPTGYAEWDPKIIYKAQAPIFTMTGCSGTDAAEVWDEAPPGIPYHSWSRARMGSNGVPTGAPPVLGKWVSWTIEVTKAYTGVAANVRLALGQHGASGLLLPGGTFDGWVGYIDLKTTGTRIIAATGNSGIQGSDSVQSTDFLISAAELKLVSSFGNLVDISGEDPSVWPEFTSTLVTDVLV